MQRKELSTNTKNRYFLTSFPPKGHEVEDGVSIAMCNFSRNLISGHIFDQVYSILPIFVNKRYKADDDAEYICSIFRPSGGVFRFVSPILEQIELFFKIEKGASLWIYNMSVLSEILFVLLRWFKPSVRIYTIVLDFTPGAKNNDRMLKYINKSDGLIVLSDSHLFTNHNKYCLPGVAPSNAASDFPVIKLPVARKFLLSGVLLEEISQISKVLKVFAVLPDCELHISGKLEDENIIKEYNTHSNIHYHGKMPWEEYLKLLHSCTFILSTRDVHAPENQCNFPSKIIESLLHNRIIISTFQYEQLQDIKFFKIGNNVDEMIKNIKHIVSKQDDDLIEYANQSHKTRKLFSVDIWKKTIENIESRTFYFK